MKLTLIQTSLYWQDREKNLGHFDRLIRNLEEQTDLVVLPEMFSTGFTMIPEKYADGEGLVLEWMKKIAAEKKIRLTGSASVKEKGKYYNRLYWVNPDGGHQFYDKRHLFRMGREDQHYTAGTEKLIVEAAGWKICPLVCYDLRFPVWSRNRYNAETQKWDYDVLIYVANWPEVRRYPWKHLLIARAIENQCFVVGLNRVGKDGNGIDHVGDSMVISPKGEIMNALDVGKEIVTTVDLNFDVLKDFRSQFPVGLDADKFDLTS